MTAHIPSRQVHLDFHTSEHIDGIGERFSKQNFQDALRAGQPQPDQRLRQVPPRLELLPDRSGRHAPAPGL